MKKNLRYLEWIPFAVCFGAFIIYIVYTINIKLNPAIIVTDRLINTLKTYLIIALVSLFIGLLIILIKKIYKLVKSESLEDIVYKETKTITIDNSVQPEERIITNTEPIQREERIVVNPTPVQTEKIREERIVVNPTPVQTEKIREEKIIVNPTPIQTEKVIYRQEKKYDDVVCHECGKIISKHAAICPNCGIVFDEEVIRVLKKYDKTRYKINPFRKIINLCLILLFIILIIIVSNMLYNRYNDNIKNVANTIVKRQ